MPANGHRPHILVVEDLPAHAQLVEEAFRAVSPNASFRVAGSAEEALAYLRTTDRPEVNLIVLDVILPRQDGLEVLAAVRRHATLSGVPVLVLSCSSDREHVDRAYSLHANCFIPKPDRFSELRDTVAASAGFWLGTASTADPHPLAPRAGPWARSIDG